MSRKKQIKNRTAKVLSQFKESQLPIVEEIIKNVNKARMTKVEELTK